MQTTETIISNGWKVSSCDINVLIEILRNNDKINWYNFNIGSFYYNNDCEQYVVVEMCNKTKEITLEKCEIKGDVIMLNWNDLTNVEKAQAKETYLCIREQEENRSRDEFTDDYPDPMCACGVVCCKFQRVSSGIEAII